MLFLKQLGSSTVTENCGFPIDPSTCCLTRNIAYLAGPTQRPAAPRRHGQWYFEIQWVLLFGSPLAVRYFAIVWGAIFLQVAFGRQLRDLLQQRAQFRYSGVRLLRRGS